MFYQRFILKEPLDTVQDHEYQWFLKMVQQHPKVDLLWLYHFMSFGDIPSHYDKYKIMSLITYFLQYHGRYLTVEILPKIYPRSSSVSVKDYVCPSIDPPRTPSRWIPDEISKEWSDNYQNNVIVYNTNLLSSTSNTPHPTNYITKEELKFRDPIYLPPIDTRHANHSCQRPWQECQTEKSFKRITSS